MSSKNDSQAIASNSPMLSCDYQLELKEMMVKGVHVIAGQRLNLPRGAGDANTMSDAR